MRDKTLIEYYRARAPEYEQIYYRDNPERRREIADEAAFLRQLVRGKEVLDVACGTGYWTQVMSGVADDIIAFDISIEMLREARKKTYPKPVRFVIGDMHRLPFQPHCFDILSVGFWFSHQPRQEYRQLFEQLKLLLKPQGKIWMIDNNPPAEGTANTSVRVDSFGNNYKRRYLDNGKEFVILKNYFEESQLQEIFQPYFTIERLVYKTYYWSVVLIPY